MINQAQIKVLDFLEYTLKVIENYDEEFKSKSIGEGKEEAKDKPERKALDTEGRFKDVKESYLQLVELQSKRGVKYVTSTTAYTIADGYIDFQKQYN